MYFSHIPIGFNFTHLMKPIKMIDDFVINWKGFEFLNIGVQSREKQEKVIESICIKSKIEHNSILTQQ